ncbi:MAG: hypothetical protein H0V12_05955 [Chloroflexi bacterium]|nr:hypothetical protein [Chloroflexota bacterium]
MIISHSHRYLFVELPRTGSMAISAELREHYGGERILGKHSNYREFLRVATPDEKGYFVFSGIRNPLDTAVSRFYQLKTDQRHRFTDPERRARRRTELSERIEDRIFRWVHETDADFESFLLRWYVMPYDTWASVDHRRFGHVLRFESLADDFTTVLRKVGLEPVRPLPVVNQTDRPGRDFTREYTPRAIARARWIFGPYMQEWGYRFPESWGDVEVPPASRVALRMLRPYRGIYWKYLRRARRRKGELPDASPQAA